MPPRQTRATGTGRAKKSGAGGKYTWGTAMLADGDEVVDQNDPNYDSGGCLRSGRVPKGGGTLSSRYVYAVCWGLGRLAVFRRHAQVVVDWVE